MSLAEGTPVVVSNHTITAGSGFRLALYNALKPLANACFCSHRSRNDLAGVVNNLADVIDDQIKTGTVSGGSIT